MTNSDGGFQFDFQQHEKPVRPTVPPIPGQETAAYSTEPTAQATPALQFPQSVQSVRAAQFAQPVKLWPGMKIGQMCFFQLSSPAEHPYGSKGTGSHYQGQRGPTPSRSYENFYRAHIDD